MPKKVVFVSVGTSALAEWHAEYSQDYNRDEGTGRKWSMDKDGYKALVEALREEEKRDEDVEFQYQKKILLEKLAAKKRKFNNQGGQDYDLLSAELASLKAMENAKGTNGQEPPGAFTDRDQIYLLYSDTIDGKLCVEVCDEALQGFIGISTGNIAMVLVEGLRMDKPHLFIAEGIGNLQTKIEKRCTDSNLMYYFNITGGYKGAIPFFTLLAAKLRNINDISLVYLFETAPQILIAPTNSLLIPGPWIFDL